MGAIDIGLPAIDRNTVALLHENTTVNRGNPANDTGVITDAEVWLDASSSSDVWLGTFSAVSNDLTCRDSESVGHIASGSKQTLSGLDIDVETGDYFGTYCKSGSASMEKSSSGEANIWFLFGEFIDPTDSGTFLVGSNDGISLFGTGATVSAVTASKSANMAAEMIAAGMI